LIARGTSKPIAVSNRDRFLVLKPQRISRWFHRVMDAAACPFGVQMNHKKFLLRFAAAFVSLAPFAGIAATVSPDALAVVASQGGQKLTFGDIDESVERVPAADRAHFIDNPRRIEALINNMLLQKQLAAQARSAGLDKDPEIAAATGLEQVELLARAQMKHFKEGIKVPDMAELASEDYIAHKERYNTPAVVDVKAILVSTSSRSEDDAKALAATIADEAKKDPTQFDALIEKYSDDPDKGATHGVVKDAGGAAHAREFAAAANALQNPGDVSPVVKSTTGFNLLQLVSRVPAQKHSFEEVREQIVARLGDEYTQNQQKDYIDGLRNNRIDADPDRVASLRTRYSDAAVAPAAAAPGAAPAAGPAAPAAKPAKAKARKS
jgi:peptidyl-prolyl cis-trans isomerase C